MNDSDSSNKPALMIFVQSTPNPDALKFILNRDVKNDGKATFSLGDDTFDNTMARDLLNLSCVKQVHFFENVITVNKEGGSWDDLDPLIKAIIETRLPSHNPDFKGLATEADRRKTLTPELQAIEEILDRTIRPGLQGDGGDLETISLDNNVLYIRYQGACGTCPSSSAGTLYAIEDILKREYNPQLEVRTV